MVLTNPPTKFSGYCLLDSGHFKKLEQVGDTLLVRPALQAIWEPRLPKQTWAKAQATFTRTASGYGHWNFRKSGQPKEWTLRYGSLQVGIRLSDFGHIGIFPEQEANMQWMEQHLTGLSFKPRVLNLFAYTGGMTLAAARAGAEVLHVDAVKSVVGWARDNARLSQIEDAPVRWMIEDVTRFVEREVRRGSRYDALILDPPSFGRGPKKEPWKIETDLVPLLKKLVKLMSDSFQFMLLSTHTPGYTPCAMANLVRSVCPEGQIKTWEMVIPEKDAAGGLPSGTCLLWKPAKN